MFATLLLAAPALVWSQELGHGYTPQDIENGGLLYQANCTGCHGPEGDGVAGVNFGSGKFRRASSDEDMARIIQVAFPARAMPPSNFSGGQASTIVAYLRSLAGRRPRGRWPPATAPGQGDVEGKGQCLTCHSVGGRGIRVAPVLTEIGSLRRIVELQRRWSNRTPRFAPTTGASAPCRATAPPLTGRLLNQDTFTVQLLDTKERLLLLESRAARVRDPEEIADAARTRSAQHWPSWPTASGIWPA